MNNQARVFCHQLATVTISGILVVIVFVSLIDPYNLYDWFKLDGINTKKPDSTRYLEEIKLTQASRLHPDLIILGNSRAEIGFDPESPSLVEQGYSAFNLAIRGSSISVSSRQLSYLLDKGIKPKKILIALDFVDFMSSSKQASENNNSFLQEKIKYPIDDWFWQFDSLFSISSIKDSITTLLIQNNPEAPSLTERGFNPLKEYLAAARNEGYYVLFRQRAEENLKTYLKKSTVQFDKSDFFYFRQILKNAASINSEVIVVIYPYHAQILALFEQLGFLPVFNQWKAEILNEMESISPLASGNISLLDFSGFAEQQCERIPAKGDLLSSTKWYWEAGHFKNALGDIVIKNSLTLSADTPHSSSIPSSFGTRLIKTNLVANQDRIRIEREACFKNYPELFEEAQLLIGSLRN